MSRARRWCERVFWDAHSITWDSGAPPQIRTQRALDVVAWLTTLGVPNHGALLDLGCATGELSVALAAAGFEVVGVDLSPLMLRRAQRKARRLNPTPAFRQADLNEPLPFPDESFDCVLCANTLQCLERPAALLREARRVLVRGGRLALLAKLPGARQSSPSSTVLGAQLFAPLKACASRWARHLPQDVLRTLAENAGFVNVKARSTADRVLLSGRAPPLRRRALAAG